jgi:PAS domain S-box-containing protein
MLNQILTVLNDYALAFGTDSGTYVFISADIESLAGYGAGAFIKNTSLWSEIIDPRDGEMVQSTTQNLTEGQNISLTYRIKTAGGKIKWVNENRSIFADAQTNQKILLSIIKDIQRGEEERYDKEESLAEYSILFDSNPNPMWLYEIQTQRILKVNDAAIKTYGYTRQEFLAMTIKDIRQNPENGNFDSFISNKGIGATFHGFNKPGVWKHINKKGEIIYAEVTSDSLSYKNYNCCIVIATNITERVRYQEELKLREQFLNSLIDSQTNFLIRIDINGRYTFVNKQFLKTLGYKNNEVIGKHFVFTTIPEERHLCQQAFINCTGNPGKVIHLLHKKPDKTGNLHDTDWEFIAITDEAGKVTGVQGIGRDITNQKNTEKEIIWTKNNLEALINNTEDLIWSVNREYNYLYMNQAYKQTILAHTGKLPVKGESSLHTVYDQATLNEWLVFYGRGLNGETYIIVNENIDQVTKEFICYEISFNPIYNADRKITGVGCFARNITDRIKINKAIIDQNDRLRNIAALSSHDLRRPVATLLGLMSIIDRQNFFNPENREIIEHMLVVGSEIDDVIRLIVNTTFI